MEATPGHAAGEDVAPVEDVGALGEGLGAAVAVGEFGRGGAGGGGVGDGEGEGAVPQELGGLGAGGGDAGGEVGLEVDVQGVVGALAEGGLHGAVGDVGGPVVVDGLGEGVQEEGDVGVGVGAFEDGALARYEGGVVLRAGLRGLVGGGHEVDVGVDDDLVREAGFAGEEAVRGVHGGVGVEESVAGGAGAALADVGAVGATRGQRQGEGEGKEGRGEEEE